MKCKRENDGRKIDHQSLQVMRQRAVKAAREGKSPKEIAEVLGVNLRSVFRWLAAFANGGQNALLAKPIPGRPPKLTAEEMQWVAKTVKDTTPQQLKFEFGLWTLSLIQEVIRRELGKDLSLSAVRRVMKLLGFTVQKPLYRAWQQDEVLVKQWVDETYPEIKAEAKRVGATIYFADEAGMRSDHHAGTTWAPRGQTPIVKVTGRRFSFNMLSAVGSRGEFRFMVHEGSCTTEVFITFLKRLLTGADKPVFLIVDGHSIHKSKAVREFVEQQEGRLRIFILPPYSPELNPDEQVWAHIKGEVAKSRQNAEQMKSLISSALHRLQKLPAIVASFFRHPDCQYAQA